MGVILPFHEGDDKDPSVVMKILPEFAATFNTKKRAPIKVVFETVKLSELRVKFGDHIPSEENKE